MNCASVLINLPAKNFDHIYKYRVPEKFEDDIAFGKRVLVELGKRKVEGFITAVEVEDLETEQLKPLIRVLDNEPVFDHSLFELAQWIAETRLCAVASVLNAMIPRTLSKKKTIVVIPLVDFDKSLNSNDSNIIATYRDFFNQLRERGEMTVKEAKSYLKDQEIDELEEQGLIFITGHYSGYREKKSGYQYKIKDFDMDSQMAALEKRSPRQATAIKIVQSYGGVDCERLDKQFPPSSIKSLIKKGYLERVRKDPELETQVPVLNKEQDKALEAIERAIDSNRREEFLLYGVTGSGKTEVYLRSAQKAIEKGKTVIVLVPEIALTRHLVDIFSGRISDMAVLHSNMAYGERYEEWKRIRRGEVQLVLGTRSAIFAPLSNLGLLIVDEEQEPSYKQEETPRYYAPEVARKRAEMESAVLVLGSATPSLETFHRAVSKETTLLILRERVKDAFMPVVEIENMRNLARGEKKVISPRLIEKLTACINRGEQSILFINRRGYAPMTLCAKCGAIDSCPICSVGLTYHSDINRNVCHYCNYQKKLTEKCPSCGSMHLIQLGSGTQRVEEEIREIFPSARIERLDLDKSKKKGVQKDILKRMKNREIDILIGTQMVAKGLDFPAVSLVGIIDSDSMLNLPDFRAGERCFQLLVQAAGRAGRANYPGEVLIQSYNPEHPVVQMAAVQDYQGFYRQEIKVRRLLKYPPFSNLLRMLVISDDEKTVQKIAAKLEEQVKEIIDAKEEGIEILGPAPCPIYKIKNRFRWQLLVKCENMLLLNSIGRYIIRRYNYKPARLEVDINPLITM
ncbi:MAG: primosomal protein N' [Syntrophomonas sp.]